MFFSIEEVTMKVPKFIVSQYLQAWSWFETTYMLNLKHWPGEATSGRNSGKLNLRGVLPWVAKRTGKFSHKYTQVKLDGL